MKHILPIKLLTVNSFVKKNASFFSPSRSCAFPLLTGTWSPRAGVWGPEQAPKVSQFVAPQGRMLPYPLRAPTWPAERGAGLCTAPSTYRLGVQGHAGRARSRVKPEAARGAQPQASTERVRISGRSPALDRRSPAEGHHDDESRRRERCSAAPRVADSAHQRRHPSEPDPRSRLSRAKVARPGRQAQPVRARPVRRPRGTPSPRGGGSRSDPPGGKRSAQRRRREGVRD